MDFFLKLLQLFYTFAKIGLFTFGGGYSAIPLVQNEIVDKLQWISYDQFLTYVAIGESTPGPFAMNIATFIGSSQAGIAGAICSTLGFAFPSFVIILIIATLVKKFSKSKIVKGYVAGVLPVAIALIFTSGISIALKTIFNFGGTISFDYAGFGIMADLLLIMILYKKDRGKRLSPIFIILIAAIFGMIVY